MEGCWKMVKASSRMARSPEAEVVMITREPGSERVSPEVFEHLVQLAALEVNPEEAEYLRREMNGQLTAIRELEATQAPEGLPIISHGAPYTPDISQQLRQEPRQ